jgi:hypothetical protein
MESLTGTGPEGPRIRVLSPGAGPQSAVLLLACEGHVPAFDAVVFADLGWQHEAGGGYAEYGIPGGYR